MIRFQRWKWCSCYTKASGLWVWFTLFVSKKKIHILPKPHGCVLWRIRPLPLSSVLFWLQKHSAGNQGICRKSAESTWFVGGSWLWSEIIRKTATSRAAWMSCRLMNNNDGDLLDLHLYQWAPSHHHRTFTNIHSSDLPKGSMTMTGTAWGVPAYCELWIANPSVSGRLELLTRRWDALETEEYTGKKWADWKYWPVLMRTTGSCWW